MAKLTGGSITLELTYEELRALIQALKCGDRYEYNDLFSPLLEALEGGNTDGN